MSRNIFEPSLYRQVQANKTRIKLSDQNPGAFKWWEPECDETDDDDAAAGCTGDEPLLENSWAQPDPPLEKFAFRLHSDGSIEFKGHLDSAAASSGTVAVTLPGAAAGEVDFRPANDQFFVTVIYDGSDPQNAMVYIDSTTGEVTITFPI